jgi:hypothetical protein
LQAYRYQAERIKRKQQTGKILIMKAIRLFKSTFILQYSDFGQHIVYAVNPFFKVTAAALQDKSLAVIHFSQIV